MAMNGTADPGDWGEAENVVSDAYFPHDLSPLSASSEPCLSLRATRIGPLRLARIGWEQRFPWTPSIPADTR